MPSGVAGGSIMGFAFETTPNTYVAPQKYIPFLSESLKYVDNKDWGREIRNSVDYNYALRGNVNIEGDITFKVREDTLLYFLYLTRAAIVKTGTTNYTYVVTPNSLLQAARTATIHLEKNGVVFAYTGCVVVSEKYSFNNGNLECTVSLLGSTEVDASTVSGITWPTSLPFAVGQYAVEIPTGTPVNTVEQFEINIENNGAPQNRIGSVGAVYQAYGERDVSLNIQRDFIDKTEYNAFKALTSTSMSLTATKGANNSIGWAFGNVIRDTYEIGLGSQGDIIMAQIEAKALNAPNVPYVCTVKTQENIT